MLIAFDCLQDVVWFTIKILRSWKETITIILLNYREESITDLLCYLSKIETKFYQILHQRNIFIKFSLKQNYWIFRITHYYFYLLKNGCYIYWIFWNLLYAGLYLWCEMNAIIHWSVTKSQIGSVMERSWCCCLILMNV